jgi:hypothetical protein
MLPLGWALTVVTSSPPIAPALPARPGLQVLAAGERDEPGTLRADAGAGDGLVPEPGSGGLRVAQA